MFFLHINLTESHGTEPMFFEKFMPPQHLFYKVTDFLRSGIKADEIQGEPVRFIYYYTFALEVVIFRREGRHESFPTKTVIYRFSQA